MSIIPAISALPALPAMPSMPMAPLGGAQGMSPSGDGGTPRAGSLGSVGPDDFAAALSSAVAGLNTQVNGAERLSEAVSTGQIADPTAALVEIEKADLAFNTAVQMRNKLVEGWQELSRMTV
ncbi:MAG: flagellar hook-basal body complex protein FliE [Miltoncostaeaceae bacterium]